MEPIANLIYSIINEHYEYLACCERNCTETYEGIAILTVKTKELQANTQLAQKYFNCQIQERNRLFSSATAILNKAIEKGNFELAQIAIETISIIQQKSPFSYNV